MSLKIFLCRKRPLPGRLVSQKAQPEAIDHIDDLFCSLFECFLLFFSGRIGANVESVSAFGDFFAVDFVDDIIDIDEVIGVGDDLVAGDDILQ